IAFWRLSPKQRASINQHEDEHLIDLLECETPNEERAYLAQTKPLRGISPTVAGGIAFAAAAFGKNLLNRLSRRLRRNPAGCQPGEDHNSSPEQIRFQRTYSAKAILDYLELSPDDVYLDLAGGPGTYTVVAHLRGVKMAIYLDISSMNMPLIEGLLRNIDNFTEEERRQLEERSSLNILWFLNDVRSRGGEEKGIPQGVKIIRADAKHISLATNSVDKLSVTDLLRWLGSRKCQDAALKEMLRVVKTGGLIHIVQDSMSLEELRSRIIKTARELGVQIEIQETVIEERDNGLLVKIINKSRIAHLFSSIFTKHTISLLCLSNILCGLAALILTTLPIFSSTCTNQPVTPELISSQELKETITSESEASVIFGVDYLLNKNLEISLTDEQVIKLKRAILRPPVEVRGDGRVEVIYESKEGVEMYYFPSIDRSQIGLFTVTIDFKNKFIRSPIKDPRKLTIYLSEAMGVDMPGYKELREALHLPEVTLQMKEELAREEEEYRRQLLELWEKAGALQPITTRTRDKMTASAVGYYAVGQGTYAITNPEYSRYIATSHIRSCIAVIIWDQHTHYAIMGHFQVIDDVDEALGLMIQGLRQHNVNIGANLKASLIGGLSTDLLGLPKGYPKVVYLQLVDKFKELGVEIVEKDLFADPNVIDQYDIILDTTTGVIYDLDLEISTQGTTEQDPLVSIQSTVSSPVNPATPILAIIGGTSYIVYRRGQGSKEKGKLNSSDPARTSRPLTEDERAELKDILDSQAAQILALAESDSDTILKQEVAGLLREQGYIGTADLLEHSLVVRAPPKLINLIAEFEQKYGVIVYAVNLPGVIIIIKHAEQQLIPSLIHEAVALSLAGKYPAQEIDQRATWIAQGALLAIKENTLREMVYAELEKIMKSGAAIPTAGSFSIPDILRLIRILVLPNFAQNWDKAVAGKKFIHRQAQGFEYTLIWPSSIQLKNNEEIEIEIIQYLSTGPLKLGHLRMKATLALDMILTDILEQSNLRPNGDNLISLTRKESLRGLFGSGLVSYVKKLASPLIQSKSLYKGSNKLIQEGLVLLKTEEILNVLSGWFIENFGDDFGIRLLALERGLIWNERSAYVQALQYLENPSRRRATRRKTRKEYVLTPNGRQTKESYLARIAQLSSQGRVRTIPKDELRFEM
ncbi:MAG: methyltransferase domain-containing protein, partial [Candidatus Omnitrophota bacterium]